MIFGLPGLAEVAITQHLQRLLREVVRQVVAIRELVDVLDRVAVNELVGVVQAREAVEDSIELVEAVLQRPVSSRCINRHMGFPCEMPFADHERRVSLITESLRDCRGDSQLISVVRVAGIKMDDVGIAGEVVIDSRHE